MKTYTESELKTTSKAVANNVTVAKPVPLKTPTLQTQLKIGKPNDEYEQEADRVADQVMSMPESSVQQQPIEEEEEMLQPKIQMQEAEEEEELLQTKPLIQLQPVEEEEEMLQPKPMMQLQPIEEEEEMLQGKWIQKAGCSNCGETEIPELQTSTQSIQMSPLSHIDSCGGQQLADSSRGFFESRMGYNFGNVRVHTCDSAVQMNQQLGAQAFTYGDNIFFNKGKFSPGSSDGKKLLAHELTHVVQQKGQQLLQRKADDDNTKEGSSIPILRTGKPQIKKKVISKVRPEVAATIPQIQLANTPDGTNLGPTDSSKTFCRRQTLWATTGTDTNTATAAQGLQTITFKANNTGQNEEGNNCDCGCAVYRHWIRGYGRRGSTTSPKIHTIGSCTNSITISETDWTEEYTSCIGDNDTDACEWEYSDAPGFSGGLSDGTYAEVHFDFKYQIWDSCRNRSIAQAKRTMDISGDTAPRSITWSN